MKNEGFDTFISKIFIDSELSTQNITPNSVVNYFRTYTLTYPICRVPTRPGKPGKMRIHLENLEISWNFEKFNKYHGKMT